MLKKLTAPLILLMLAVLLCLPAAAAQSGEVSLTAAKVTADLLNFRTAPNTDAGIIGTAPEGETVLVFAEENGWCRVLWNGREGWMSKKYLEYVSEAMFPVGPGWLTGNYVRLRSGPSTNSEILSYLYIGDRVDVIGAAGQWYRVAHNGSYGYVYSGYVRIASAPAGSDALREQIVDTVKSCLGYGYSWGGTSPDTGFDCSGLVCYTYSSCGISLPRTATSMYEENTQITQEELLPGDLVFFTGSSGWYITHVGIYTGDGYFIHASTGSAVVKTNSLSEKYFSDHYYGAARVLTS